MAKITEDHIKKAFSLGKRMFNKEITLSKASEELENLGMKRSSARDYLYAYSNLIQGKLFTRNMNVYSTEYYLNEIYKGNGINGLRKALLSLNQHLDYSEDASGSSVVQRREVYKKYYELLEVNYGETIFPDEIDLNGDYSEGKTRSIKVNSYERNQLARQECIEHFGLNCQVCDFNFENQFGQLGKDFIHVHHIVEISTVGKEYSINPKSDLIPVCPNCHAMLHKRKPAYSVSEMRDILS